jgi:hypothetical protein
MSARRSSGNGLAGGPHFGTIHVARAAGWIAAACLGLGCSSKSRDRTGSPNERPIARSIGVLPPNAPDSAVLPGAGVPTDSDDTLGTQYGKHIAPRPVPAPDCLPAGIALCISDTATKVESGDVTEGDGGINPERQTDWLVFAAARDSMQLFVVSPGYRYLSLHAPTKAAVLAAPFHSEGTFGVDGSWMRMRFPYSGTYVFTAAIDGELPMPYELRVAAVMSTVGTHPIGSSATLTIKGDSSSLVAIAPAAVASRTPAAEWERFAVHPGSYRVLLVRDPTYLACRLPCGNSRSFTLYPGQSLTVTP